MRTTLKRIFIMTLTVVLLCCSVVPCFAAAEKGIMALKLAFAMVLGIVVMVSIPKQFFSVQYWKIRKTKKSVVSQ